jgi:hypothetical protein
VQKNFIAQQNAKLVKLSLATSEEVIDVSTATKTPLPLQPLVDKYITHVLNNLNNYMNSSRRPIQRENKRQWLVKARSRKLVENWTKEKIRMRVTQRQTASVDCRCYTHARTRAHTHTHTHTHTQAQQYRLEVNTDATFPGQ